MNLTAITYGRLFNMGNYENEKVSFSAGLEEADNLQDVLLKLKQLVREAHITSLALEQLWQEKGDWESSREQMKSRKAQLLAALADIEKREQEPFKPSVEFPLDPLAGLDSYFHIEGMKKPPDTKPE